MVYRIHFEPRGGYWCVQFHRYYCFWDTVKAPLSDSDKEFQTLKFRLLKEAEDYVTLRGIDQVYQRSHVSAGFATVAAGGMIYQQR